MTHFLKQKSKEVNIMKNEPKYSIFQEVIFLDENQNIIKGHIFGIVPNTLPKLLDEKIAMNCKLSKWIETEWNYIAFSCDDDDRVTDYWAVMESLIFETIDDAKKFMMRNHSVELAEINKKFKDFEGK